MSTKYLSALKEFKRLLSKSADPIELSHAENTLYWLKQINSKADEVLCLAAYAHDIERSVPDKANKSDYDDYEEYKRVHSKRSGTIAANILRDTGYAEIDATRIRDIIMSAEFESKDPDIQLVCDADSVSFFDNNIENYILKNGDKKTGEKARFMYKRTTTKARMIIKDILKEKNKLYLLDVKRLD